MDRQSLYSNVQRRRISPLPRIMLVPSSPGNIATVILIEQEQLAGQTPEALCNTQLGADHSLCESAAPGAICDIAVSPFGRGVIGPCLDVSGFRAGWDISVV